MRVHRVLLLVALVFAASVAAQDNANAGDTSMGDSARGSGSGWTGSRSAAGSMKSHDMGGGSWGSHSAGSWGSHSAGSWGSHSADSGSRDYTIETIHSDSGSKSKPINGNGGNEAGTDKESATTAPPTVSPNTKSAATQVTPDTTTTVACILAAIMSAYFA
ncbi:hypothetical protein Gpo141_00000249 [Globisporangium polare]